MWPGSSDYRTSYCRPVDVERRGWGAHQLFTGAGGVAAPGFDPALGLKCVRGLDQQQDPDQDQFTSDL